MIENQTTVRVRYADTDQMGLVYHARYLEWFEIGRTELLRALGLPYATLEEKGWLLPVIEVRCRYKIPARYDQVVSIISRIAEIPRGRIHIDYQLESEDGALLAEGYTEHMFVNREGKPLRPPKEFIELLKANI